MSEKITTLKDVIIDYSGSVEQRTVKDHIAFLSNMGKKFSKINGGDFEIDILKSMESTIKKILDDLESGRHRSFDKETFASIEDLVDINVSLVRAYRKNLDISQEWSKNLREYIKILKNLSIAALIITSNELSEKPKKQPASDMRTLFDWYVPISKSD
jgi:hypothetical protein